jgi:hypothetical protein
VHVVATLRIAEHIEAGATDVETIAEAAGCDAWALHRVLTYLAGKGLFEEIAPGRFALNEAARGLLDPAQRIGLERRLLTLSAAISPPEPAVEAADAREARDVRDGRKMPEAGDAGKMTGSERQGAGNRDIGD